MGTFLENEVISKKSLAKLCLLQVFEEVVNGFGRSDDDMIY